MGLTRSFSTGIKHRVRAHVNTVRNLQDGEKKQHSKLTLEWTWWVEEQEQCLVVLWGSHLQATDTVASVEGGRRLKPHDTDT